MKARLTISFAMIGLTAMLLGSSQNDEAKRHIAKMRADGSITNVIAILIADGTFCQVSGHVWGQHSHNTLEYSPSRVNCRQCAACGLHQEQHVTSWK